MNPKKEENVEDDTNKEVPPKPVGRDITIGNITEKQLLQMTKKQLHQLADRYTSDVWKDSRNDS